MEIGKRPLIIAATFTIVGVIVGLVVSSNSVFSSKAYSAGPKIFQSYLHSVQDHFERGGLSSASCHITRNNVDDFLTTLHKEISFC